LRGGNYFQSCTKRYNNGALKIAMLAETSRREIKQSPLALTARADTKKKISGERARSWRALWVLTKVACKR
jgi:hypothetical protein